MADAYCRLCLSRENLLDIFNPELTNSEQLQTCILICSGVNILWNDIVTKHVCHTCCEISIKLFKFRKNALANDKALKGIFHQKALSQIPDSERIAQLNEFLVKTSSVKIRTGDELNVKLPTALRTKRYTVHPTVHTLVNRYPKIKLPEEVITENCNPRIYIENLDVSKRPKRKFNASRSTNKDIDLFKQKCPGVSIVILSGNQPVSRDSSESEEDDGDVGAVQSDYESETPPDPTDSETEQEDHSKRVREEETVEETPAKKPRIDDELKIPEPTSKIKDFLEAFTADDSIVDDNKCVATTFSAQEINELRIPVEDDNVEENLEVSMLTANLPVQSNIPQQAEQSSIIPQQVKIVKEPQYSTTDDDEEDDDEPIRPKILRPRKSRPSFFPDDVFDDSDDDYVPEPEPDYDPEDDDECDKRNWNLLETFNEEMAFTCDICSKMFDHPTKLKLHRRMHKDCIVCKKTFISQKALNYHLNETCYKRVIANQPTLCLKRCDEEYDDDGHSDIKQPSNSDERDFEVLCISDDDEQQRPSVRKTEKWMQMEAREMQKISQIFQKYHRNTPPYHKVNSCQDDSKLFSVSMGKGQATMENMYPILKYFRVPVMLHASESMKVDMVDRIEQVRPEVKKVNWFVCPIKNLVSFSKKSNTRQIAPKPAVPPIPKHQEIANKILSSMTLNDMLNKSPSSNSKYKIRHVQIQNNIATTTAVSNTQQPIILNTLQGECLQPQQSIVLNGVTNDRILTIQLPTQSKLHNVVTTQPQSIIPTQFTIQTQRPLPAIIPKTYTAKPRAKPVYQKVQKLNVISQSPAIASQTQAIVSQTKSTLPQSQTINLPTQAIISQPENLISQIQTISPSQPHTIPVQQSHQAYIQTSEGYVLQTTQNTLTTVASQNSFTLPVQQNTFSPTGSNSRQLKNSGQSTVGLTKSNKTKVVTVSRSNILTSNAYNVPTTASQSILNFQPNDTKSPASVIVNNKKLQAILPKPNPVSAPEQETVIENTKTVEQTEPIETIQIYDCENTQNHPEAPSKPSNNDGNAATYIRVKAPWELNDI